MNRHSRLLAILIFLILFNLNLLPEKSNLWAVPSEQNETEPVSNTVSNPEHDKKSTIDYDLLHAERLFSSASEKYTRGNNEDAMKELTECLQLNPQHSAAKNFLKLCLAEVVAIHYNEKNYVGALPYLEKLARLFPEDLKIQDMYERLKDRIEQKLEQARDVPVSTEEIENLFSLLERPIHEQERLLNEYKGEQKILMETVLTQARKVQNQLTIQFKQKEERTLTTLIRTHIFTAVSTIIILVILVFSIIIYIRKSDRRREEIMMSSYEKIIDRLQPFIATTTQESFKPSEFPKMLSSINPEGRLHGIEVIEAELVTETGRDIGERLLQPFLEDSDMIVKSRAFQTLYKYNSNKALDGLSTMSKALDRNTRICAAETLGQIPSEESTRQLLEMKNDTDEQVKRVVLKSLSEIYEEKKVSLTNETLGQVEKFLDEAKNEWVFK